MDHRLRDLSYLIMGIIVSVWTGCSTRGSETRQEHVHRMAHQVMPFAMDKTLHSFRMTESGGVLRVLARDPGETDQVALIRAHLRHEAQRFEEGNYADPGTLHGTEMPGLKELQAGASRMRVSYEPIPSGAEITFRTEDAHLVTAVHRWFGAQLSEHGADARAE